MVRKLDADHRVAPRLDRRADQLHVGLGRGAATFSHIALQAGADDVFPRVRAATRARNDMVEAQLGCAKALAAILAGIVVARKEVATIELHVLSWELGESQHAYDARHHHVEAHRPNPIVIVGLEFPL